MARDPRHDALFEPLQIGPKTLRNRFYQVPHCTGFGTLKPSSQVSHRAVKAEGGWAAVCTEFAPISPDTDDAPSGGANIWDGDDAANLSLMCAEVQRHGALAGIELVHKGAHARQGEARRHRLAPSQLASDRHTINVPKAMEPEDVARAQQQFADAAIRARDCGFDIVCVYAGDSYLPMQFLSPFYNHRQDAYGGSLERRARFLLETLAAVRAAVGDDCAISVRISVDALGL